MFLTQDVLVDITFGMIIILYFDNCQSVLFGCFMLYKITNRLTSTLKVGVSASHALVAVREPFGTCRK